MASDEHRLRVGDVGTVVEHSRSGLRRENVRVVKVGRRWAYVEPDIHGRFDVETGAQDGGIYGSRATFYTPESLARRDAVAAARAVIRDAGLEVRMGYSSQWPDSDVLDLAAWLASRG